METPPALSEMGTHTGVLCGHISSKSAKQKRRELSMCDSRAVFVLFSVCPVQPERIAAVLRQFQAKIIAAIFAFRVALSPDLSYNEVNPNWRSIR